MCISNGMLFHNVKSFIDFIPQFFYRL
uniref:Uncharacterized protein n=1 Tax=Arundo donax TaxID=35708 RepID=A0A0A8YGB5_ARUDO